SPVTRYWVAHSVGFSLDGGAHGTVERVLAEDDPLAPSHLEVRTKRQRLRRIPVSAVIAVVPSERRLVVEGGRAVGVSRHPQRKERLNKAAALAGRGAITTGILLLDLATLLARFAREAWRVGAPVVAAASKRGYSAGRRGGRESVRLVRSVPWQRYGRSARSATTRLSQASSTRLSHRRTTSSEPTSVKSSAERARVLVARAGLRGAGRRPPPSRGIRRRAPRRAVREPRRSPARAHARRAEGGPAPAPPRDLRPARAALLPLGRDDRGRRARRAGHPERRRQPLAARQRVRRGADGGASRRAAAHRRRPPPLRDDARLGRGVAARGDRPDGTGGADDLPDAPARRVGRRRGRRADTHAGRCPAGTCPLPRRTLRAAPRRRARSGGRRGARACRRHVHAESRGSGRGGRP